LQASNCAYVAIGNSFKNKNLTICILNVGYFTLRT
jgi:hypothetical protein